MGLQKDTQKKLKNLENEIFEILSEIAKETPWRVKVNRDSRIVEIPKHINTRVIVRKIVTNGHIKDIGFIKPETGKIIKKIGYEKDNPNNCFPSYHYRGNL